jgi:hypothetical protein
MRRVLSCVAALSAGLSIAACGGSTLTGSGSAAVTSSTSFPSTSATVPTSSSSQPTSSVPTSIPPSSIPTSSSPTTPIPTTTTAPNATRDITDIRYNRPKGFIYGVGYTLNNPAEQSFKARFLIPRGTQPGSIPDVIGLVLYRLPAAARVITPQEQLARVQFYNRKAHATVQSGIHAGTVGGYPALQENAIEEGAQGTYRYAAWYVFGTRHVVLVTCQVNSKVAQIAAGCQSLLESIRFTG